MKTSERVVWAGTFSALFIFIYFIFQKMGAFMAAKAFSLKPFILPGESDIPLVPEMIIVYSLLYIAPLGLFFVLNRRRHLKEVFQLFGMLVFIHALYFVFFPMNYVLRPPHLPEGFFQTIVKVFYSVDGTFNTYPSMHVTFAFVSAFILKKHKHFLTIPAFIFAILVTVSTVLVRQHYILDAVSGTVLAVVFSLAYITPHPFFQRKL